MQQLNKFDTKQLYEHLDFTIFVIEHLYEKPIEEILPELLHAQKQELKQKARELEQKNYRLDQAIKLLLKMGTSVHRIAERIGIPLERVLKLKQEMSDEE